MNVTKVTTGCILSDEDYREMYAELEGDGTPHTVVKRIGEPPTATAWYKWRKGDAALTANMQAKLRAAHGIVTVMDACATASETSTVYMVGSGVPDTVVMVAGTEPITLRVNGSVTVCDSLDVTPVTTRSGTLQERTRYVRPCATKTQQERRIAVNATWAEIIEAGLKAYEVIA